jgi:hypothetical protein
MIGKKIKVALCLSGEPRSSMVSFPYIYETFLRPNPIYETDVYIYSRSGFRALELYNPTNYIIDRSSGENYFLHYLSNTLPNFSQEVSNFVNSSLSNISHYSNNVKNSVLMFDNIKNCFNLIQEPYDVYIRIRYDIYFKSKYFLEHTLFDILNGKYDMFIPQQYPNRIVPNEYNDQIAIGNYKSMNLYSDIINQIPNLIKKTKSFNTQIWLKQWLDDNNIKINESHIDYRLIRQCNIITNDETFNNFLDE